MWKWNSDWRKKYWPCSYFFFFLLSLFFFSFVAADPLNPDFFGERHFERIKKYAKLSYTFSVVGGEKSLKIGECRKVVVSVKKGKLPVAGKTVAVSFSRVVKIKRDDQSETVFTDHFEQNTDYLGQINFCFAAEKQGFLEVLFFFLDSTHRHSQHLSRLYYEIYDGHKAYWAFFLPFWVLGFFSLFILAQMFIVSFFPRWAYFFVASVRQKSSSKRWYFDKMVLFLLANKQSLRFIFPVLWCHPHPWFSPKAEQHATECSLAEKQETEQPLAENLLTKHFLAEKEVSNFLFCRKNILEQIVFSLGALSWVFLYGYFPSLGLLIVLLFYRQKWFSGFFIFVLIQWLFSLGLPSSEVSINYLYGLASKDFFYGMVIFAFFFPFPLIWLGFLFLVLQNNEPQWVSKMIEGHFSFLNSTDLPSIFVLARPLFLAFCVSSVASLNVYCCCQRKMKKEAQ